MKWEKLLRVCMISYLLGFFREIYNISSKILITWFPVDTKSSLINENYGNFVKHERRELI
jgi:hypothetical protein